MTYQVRRHADSRALLDRAERWLLRSEAEHNLILGIAYRLRGTERSGQEDFFFASVEREGEVAGCAFRTPPFKLVLTEMPEGAVRSLADAVGKAYAAIPGVSGPEDTVREFASIWSEVHGRPSSVGMRLRIYQLDELIPPGRPAPGFARVASVADVDLIASWHATFSEEAHVQVPVEARRWAEERISSGGVVIWEDSGPKSMAARVGDTPNGARVGAVYTPREWRGRGYASACVAALSSSVLESGRRFCFLYTDLSNPTSNSIYQQIGYRPVRDVVEYLFDSSA